MKKQGGILETIGNLIPERKKHKLYAKLREESITTKCSFKKKVCNSIIKEMNLDGKKF